MELDPFGKPLSAEIMTRIKKSQEDEHLNDLRGHLVKGKWFIAGAESIMTRNPVYYDRTGAWWLWNDHIRCWEEKDETDVLVMCRRILGLLGDTSVQHGKRLLEALRQVSRDYEPQEPPLNMIQFGDMFIDIETGDRTPSTPNYFSTNSIPWNVGKTSDTPVMDELITSWVGADELHTVYQIIAYCAYRDYPIHRIFCFVGSGANGKTRLLKIIERFVGENNKASVTLKKVGNSDFALYPLYRKSVCFIGETAHHRLDSTEILKALSGQDPVSFEAKGRNAFTGQNYAKLIIGTNVLPPSSDTSRGWYRRWFVLKFPNEFEEGEDVLSRIPDQEYENLAAKCVKILPDLLKKGGFHTEGTIEERQKKYVETSNPLKEFISKTFEKHPDSRIRYTETYLDYLSFLSERKLRRISKREFSQALEDEGLETQKTSKRDESTNEVVSFNVILGLEKKPHFIAARSDKRVLDDGHNRRLLSDESGGIDGSGDGTQPLVDVPRITSPPDILTFLRENTGGTFTEILDAVSPDVKNAEKWLMVNLQALAKRGDIFNDSPDHWRIL